MVPSILPDPVRDEVTNLYCPGNSSPLPHLAKHTFRPRSAPPLVQPRNKKLDFRSLNNSPTAKSPDFLSSKNDRIGDVYPLFRNSSAARNAIFRPKEAADTDPAGRPGTAGTRRPVSRPKTAITRSHRPALSSTSTTSSGRSSVGARQISVEGSENVCKMVSFASNRPQSSSVSIGRPKTSTGKRSMSVMGNGSWTVILSTF